MSLVESPNKSVDLGSYIFPIIEYDPLEKPRGVVTADEWNTIMSLLKKSANYTSEALQDVFQDLYTKSQLANNNLGLDGSRLIGVDVIPGVQGNTVNSVLRNLKEQIDGVVLGAIPDGSVTSEKLARDIDTRGVLKNNGVKVLNENYFTNSLTSLSTATQIPNAKITYEALTKKQNAISMGSAEPNRDTPGNIYFQYID